MLKLYRSFIYFLINKEYTYYFGMILVRAGRILRKLFYTENNIENNSIVLFFNKVKLNVNRNNYMGGMILWTGFHHLNEILYLNKFLKKDMTFVDIGANQGEFSLFAASKLDKGLVISFEPLQKNIKALRANIALNGFSNIIINEFGLSNKNEKLPIYTSENKLLHSGTHEGLSSIYKSSERSTLEEIVEIKAFDDEYYNQLKRLDFVKIDIEGAELYCLKGMEKTIKKFKPQILIEINEETFNSAGYTKSELIEYIKDLKYSIFKIKKGKLKFIPNPNNNILEDGNYVLVN
jgi:FkbM family methyltransferase